MNDDDFNSSDEENDDSNEEQIVYNVDEDTISLLEVALNSIMQISDMQVDDAGALALAHIADELGDRFGINRYEVIETRHLDDNGREEIIYSPKGGLMNDDEPEEDDK